MFRAFFTAQSSAAIGKYFNQYFHVGVEHVSELLTHLVTSLFSSSKICSMDST